MLVKCIANSASQLKSDREKKAYARNIHQDQVWLEIGKEYIVYGISFTFGDGENVPWFLVCEEEDDEYLKPHLSAFFEIIDGSIPSGWAFTSVRGNAGDVAVLPKAWAEDPSFLERLDNEEDDAIAYFRQLSQHLRGEC